MNKVRIYLVNKQEAFTEKEFKRALQAVFMYTTSYYSSAILDQWGDQVMEIKLDGDVHLQEIENVVEELTRVGFYVAGGNIVDVVKELLA